MTKIINQTDVNITPDGLLRLDGFSAFRKVTRGGIIYVQFCDRDRMRAQCRGTRLIEIPLALLVEILTLKDNEQPTTPTNE